MARLPDLPDEVRDSQEYLEIIKHRPGVFGMYSALLHHPLLAAKVADLGKLIRFEGVLSFEIKEMAILSIARLIGAPFVWEKHLQPAMDAGIVQEVIDWIKASPSSLPPPEERLYRIWQTATFIAKQAEVPKELQDSLIESLGLQGYVEVVAICAFYKFIASIAGAFGVAPDKDHGF